MAVIRSARLAFLSWNDNFGWSGEICSEKAI